MRLFILFFIFVPLFSLNIAPPNYNGKVRFIKQVKFNPTFDGFSFCEISDLAYNKNKKLLYMISDEGILYTFKAKFNENDFKLIPLKATYFKRKNGKPLRRWNRDTEGLALDNKGNIFVSREGEPKITQFRENGVKVKNLKLPKALKNVKLRSNNKSLESLAWHPKFGLLTALEWAKKGKKPQEQTIYSLSGKEWNINIAKIKRNGISEIETMDDGNLLILQRAYNGMFGRFVVTLQKLYINNCNTKFCPKETIFSMDNSKGWYVENYEGLARVGKNRYLMISDDNNSFFQSTILIYFEIIAK